MIIDELDTLPVTILPNSVNSKRSAATIDIEIIKATVIIDNTEMINSQRRQHNESIGLRVLFLLLHGIQRPVCVKFTNTWI
jgi:hypothetical protein